MLWELNSINKTRNLTGLLAGLCLERRSVCKEESCCQNPIKILQHDLLSLNKYQYNISGWVWEVQSRLQTHYNNSNHWFSNLLLLVLWPSSEESNLGVESEPRALQKVKLGVGSVDVECDLLTARRLDIPQHRQPRAEEVEEGPHGGDDPRPGLWLITSPPEPRLAFTGNWPRPAIYSSRPESQHINSVLQEHFTHQKYTCLYRRRI